MLHRNLHIAASFMLLAGLLLPQGARAEETQAADARFQATYVWQRKPSFRAAYSGQNSLVSAGERSHSFTATAFLGARTWRGGEVYFDPEVAFGAPLSNLTGLGGFTNGETARTTGRNPTFYRARLFLRQTWGLGGEEEQLDSEPNQLAGIVDARRVVLTAGNLSALDIFDDNAYSHEPRQQFLNWALFTHGAWDFPADARGYSWGAVLEYIAPGWGLRAGRFMQPRQSNGLQLNYSIANSYGDAIELERGYALGGQPGRVRLLAFHNRANMGGFRDALALAPPGAAPDLAVTRRFRDKRGYGLNIEQGLSQSVGAFLRASRNDGEAETYAFTEIDRSLSGGVLIKGSAWGRIEDSLGFALARNGLSQPHRDYLAAGGMGFFIGDGRLSYRPETIVEAFYNLQLRQRVWLSLDVQRIANPAYNADRGPVTVWGLRLHSEF
jgi:high affinity Mn2+ porin